MKTVNNAAMMVMILTLAAACGKKDDKKDSDSEDTATTTMLPLPCETGSEAVECVTANQNGSNTPAIGTLAINLTGAIALGVGADSGLSLTGDGNLFKIKADGSMESVITGGEIKVSNLSVAPDNRVFITVQNPIQRSQLEDASLALTTDEKEDDEKEKEDDQCLTLIAKDGELTCLEYHGNSTAFEFTSDNTVYYKMDSANDSGIRRRKADSTAVEKLPFHINTTVRTRGDLVLAFGDHTLNLIKGEDTQTFDFRNIQNADFFPDGFVYIKSEDGFQQINVETGAIETVQNDSALCGYETEFDRCTNWVSTFYHAGDKVFASHGFSGMMMVYPTVEILVSEDTHQIDGVTSTDDALYFFGRKRGKSTIYKVNLADNAVTTLYETSDRINSMTVADGKILFSGIKGLKPVVGSLPVAGGEATVTEGEIELIQVEAVK